MQKNKIIAIWGSPDSGKTTFSIKLANELTKRKKNVILVLSDNMVPTLSTVLPFIETKDQSLGAILSAVQITQEAILQMSIGLKDNKQMSILSYLHGENDKTYAKYSKERAVDLMILLKHLADHIIIDCTSRVHEDIFTKTVLEVADQVIRLVTPDLKAISYFDSYLLLLAERRFNIDNHLKVLSNVKADMAKDVVANKFGGISYELAYSKEIEKQFIEARLFDQLISKQSQPYNKTMLEIMKQIIESDKDDVTKPKSILLKKRGEGN